MKAVAKRRVAAKLDLRCPGVSYHSLKMMVMSGVVRRADLDPPQDPVRTGYWHREVAKANLPQQSVSEQGWISRMILGRKAESRSAQRL